MLAKLKMVVNARIFIALLAMALVGVIALPIGTTASAEKSTSSLNASVTPVFFSSWQSGDAYAECNRANSECGDYAYKFDGGWGGGNNGARPVDGGNVITISNDSGGYFDWSSNYPVCTVIVKAGTEALVYYYPGGSTGDTGLRAPERNNQRDNDGDGLVNEDPIDGIDNDGDTLIDEDSATTGLPRDISHVTFCYDEPEVCWEEETAWASGTRYVTKGNWAMYTSYQALLAGVSLIADGGSCPTVIGTATGVNNGNGTMTITINLSGAIFYYDAFDPFYDNNLKVQDYSSTPPKKNPAPGLFKWKVQIQPGSTTGSIIVPVNNFYGIHLDVALPCDHCGN